MFEENLLKKYLKNPKFEIRIRGKEELNVKVYYNGIKYFDYENGKFKLNEAVFLPNNKNRKNLEMNKIPKKVQEAVEEIESLDFKFTVGEEIEGIQGKNIYLPYKVRKKTTETIKKELELEWKEKYFKKLIVKRVENEDYNGYFFCIEEQNTIEFNKLYNLLLTGYKKCPSIKFYANLVYEDILKIKNAPTITSKTCGGGLENLVAFTIKDEKHFDDFFNQLDKIMQSRIDVYIGENKDKLEDYILTRKDSEKSYQQKLMEIMNDRNSKKHLEKEIFDGENIEPFEMEYVIYAKGKNDKDVEARIDNLAVKNNVLVMLELKMGTKVISGTNGIHKHLLDLCNIFEREKNILNQIAYHINQRNKILKDYEIDKKYRINEGKNIILKGKEYYIICGYNKEKGIAKEEIRKELDRIYNKTIKDVDLFKTLQNSKRSKLTEDSPTVKRFHKKLDEKYDENLLNMTIPEYVQKLENKYKCKAKIYLVNEEYTEFEEY